MTAHIGIISQGIDAEFGQCLGVLNEAQQMRPTISIVRPTLLDNRFPSRGCFIVA